jgi:hypothetical protein
MKFRSSAVTLSDRLNKLIAALTVPWSAFVVAFLYYTLMAIFVLGGGSPNAGTMVFAYAVPPAMYVATLVLRASRAIAGVAGRTAHLTPTAHSAA